MTYESVTFTSGGVPCDAWHFAGAGDGLAKAGLDVLAFDYRGFGASGGSPRQVVSMAGQLADYRAAMAAAARLPGSTRTGWSCGASRSPEGTCSPRPPTGTTSPRSSR